MGWQDLPGWSESDVHEVYTAAVREAPKGATLVEVGVAFGRSLAFLARQVIDQRRADLQIYGVDVWGEQDWVRRDCLDTLKRYAPDTWKTEHAFYDAFAMAMQEHAPAEAALVSICRTLSVEAAAFVSRPWFVFIDADHDYESVKLDIAAWSRVVLPGGILAGHDWGGGHPGVPRAVREAFGVEGKDFEVNGSCWIRRVPS